jgi:DUF1680 family protein
MKFCPECGFQITDAMKFCPSCGTDLNAHREREARRLAEDAAQAGPVPSTGESVPETQLSESETLLSESEKLLNDLFAEVAPTIQSAPAEEDAPADSEIPAAFEEPAVPDVIPALPDEIPETPEEIPAVPVELPDDIPAVPDFSAVPAEAEPELPAVRDLSAPQEEPEEPEEPKEPEEPVNPEEPPEPLEEPGSAPSAGCAAYQPIYKEAIRRARDHFYYADARFALPGGSFAFSDDLSGELDAMLDIQLTDADLWAKFVELFKHPGVDDADCGWRCEYWGKMMRGACFTYAALPASAAETADRLYGVLEATVRDLLTAQDEYGRFSTYSVDAEFRGWDIWGRKYVLLGMIYFLDICRDDRLADEIVDALKRHTDYMISKLGTPEEGKRLIAACSNNWDGLNSCSLLEPVMLLYNITHEARYFDFAEYILSFGGTLHQNLFELAWEDEVSIADYSITKAYEMISCFEGLAEYAKLTGNSFAREAVVRFADRVLREEETVIGCLGCEYESFDKSAVEQFDENRTGIMQETCVTVTWMKFCWQLWRMTGEDKWIDALERSAYNAMSAALRRRIDPEANGGVAIPIHSYNPLRHDVRADLMGGRKTITEESCYGCCVCISSAGFALDTLAAAGIDRKGTIYLNLYRSGTLTVGDFTLRIDTDYPKSGEIRFTADGFEGERTLVLRIPAWASEASLTTGGVSVGCDGPNHTLTVTPGAVFTLNLGMPVTVVTPEEASHGLAECDKYLAVERGPVVFALDECEEEEPVVPVDEARVNDWGEGNPISPDDAPVPCRQAVRIPLLNRGSVTLVDYASAGQESGHKVCAWLRVK